MKLLAASLVAAAFSVAACQPEPVQREPVRTAFPEPVDIKADANGRITVNGEVVSLEQFKTRMENNGVGSILVEHDADGKAFVTVNNRKMTLDEYRAFVAAMTKKGTRQ